MAKHPKGTVLTITDAMIEADRLKMVVQAYFRANPDMSENSATAAGHGQMFKDADKAWRVATGSKNTLVFCTCRMVNPHLNANRTTTCCGATTVTVCA